MTANYHTYSTLQSTVEELSKQFTSKKAVVVTNLINLVYLSEIMAALDSSPRPPFWLLRPGTILRPVAPTAITGITVASPGVFTAVGHGLSTGDIVMPWGVVGMTEVNGEVLTVKTVPTADTVTFEFGLGNSKAAYNTSSFTAYSSGGYLYHHGTTLPDAFHIGHIHNASLIGSTGPMIPKNVDDWAELIERLDTPPTGQPKYYRHLRAYTDTGVDTDIMLWSPLPDQAYSIKYNFVEEAFRLSSNPDVPLLPPKFHDIIVSGCMTRIVEGSDQVGVEKASMWPNTYAAQLEALLAYNEKYWNNIDNQQEVRNYMA